MRGSRFLGAVFGLSLLAASAHAEDEAGVESAAPGWDYPKAYASRPLTMDKFMIRGTFLVGVKRAVPGNISGKPNGAPLVSIDMGLAFSVNDKLEVGVSNYRLGASRPNTAEAMFPIVVAPLGTFGDMPLYVRYSFLRRDKFQMAADFGLLIPSWTNLAASVGLPMRFYLRDAVAIDTGVEFRVLSNGAGLNVETPIKATFNITPAGFIFGESGFSFQNLARNLTGGSYEDTSLAFPVARNQIFVPLGVGGGYTHVVKNIVMLDVFAQFGWNPFVYVNPPSGIDTVPVTDSWILTVGVLIHTSPVIHEGEGTIRHD